MRSIGVSGLSTALATAVALAVTAGFGAGAAAQTKTLNWLTYKPAGAGDAQAVTTQWFADAVEKRTKGAVKIKIHWGGSVAKINEIPDAVGKGLGDMGDVVTPYFPDKMPVNNAISFFIPQPHSSVELGILMEKWNGKYPQFAQELGRYNLKVVGFRPLEPYGLICTKPVRSLDEFKGKRIRSYGFALPALIKALGGTPVSMGTPETYEALQRGILDCSPIGPNLARGWKFDEVAKYYVDVPLGASWGHLIVVNLNSWKSLDATAQDIIQGVGTEYLVHYTKALDIEIEKIKELWKKELKVEVVPFPREQLAKAAQNADVQKVRQEWVDKVSKLGLPGADIADELAFQ
ncbi:MAG: C4-dicarboxylate TRAP transporter substrate-binding protein [Proteobacteria bacterium]|nr:C4-dicarboxylate TRAP transporter substrate-binding protein [Pseudomonadota bacterium]